MYPILRNNNIMALKSDCIAQNELESNYYRYFNSRIIIHAFEN